MYYEYILKWIYTVPENQNVIFLHTGAHLFGRVECTKNASTHLTASQ